MRGKVVLGGTCFVRNGITPAYAGKRSGNHADQVGNRDHPRLCGEKIKVFVLEVDVVGSPPPMRGKGFNPKNINDYIRITPAYAGKRIRRRATKDDW